MGALGLAAVLAAAAVAGAPGAGGPAAVLGVSAVALLGVSLARASPRLVGPAVGLLAAAFGLSAIGRDSGVDAGAALFGVALLAVAELTYWSVELRTPLVEAPGAHRVRWRRLGTLLAGSAALGMAVLVVGAAAAEAGAGLAVPALATGAALASVALLWAVTGRAAR